VTNLEFTAPTGEGGTTDSLPITPTTFYYYGLNFICTHLSSPLPYNLHHLPPSPLPTNFFFVLWAFLPVVFPSYLHETSGALFSIPCCIDYVLCALGLGALFFPVFVVLLHFTPILFSLA
jgi:hypothetical protein